MKVYKITLCYIDFDGIGDEDESDVKEMIENARCGNHVTPGDVMEMKSVEIGEWDDDNPLNNHKTHKQEFERLFPS